MLPQTDSSFSQYRVISFDLDDTLYANPPVLAAAEKACEDYLAEQFSAHQIPFSYRDFEAIKSRLMLSSDPAFDDLTLVRRTALQQICQPLPRSEQHAEKALLLFLTRRSQVTIEPAIDSLLSQLAAKFSLVAITNGNCEVGKLSIGHYFSRHYSPCQGFRAKPHPQMLLQVIADFSLQTGQLVHVGDSLAKDGLAAQSAGADFIAFSPFSGEISLPEACQSLLARLLGQF